MPTAITITDPTDTASVEKSSYRINKKDGMVNNCSMKRFALLSVSERNIIKLHVAAKKTTDCCMNRYQIT